MQDRLVGDEAPVGRFPYICSLRRRGSRKHACGATLVDPRWVLTAAHCVDPDRRDSAGLVPIVYCGIHDLNEENPDLTFNGIRTVMHFSWTGITQEGYDIAMVQLDKSAQLTAPVLNAPGNLPEPNELLAALGWGETPNNPSPDKLHLATRLNFVSYGTCNTLWEGEIPSNIVLCAGIGERDTCRGDSGGPLLKLDAPRGEVGDGAARLDLLLGVISFGVKSCGDGARPGVYTDVGYFREWILEIIEGRSPSPAGSPKPPEREPCATPPMLKDVVTAIRNDNVITVRTALDCGLDPDSRYNDTTTAETGRADDTLLHWTARYDSSDSAKVLIDSGAEVELKNSFGNTPLHYGGIFGSLPVAQVLIDNGADVNANGLDRYTPLHYAARYGKPEIAELLLESGADVDARANFEETSLHRASWTGEVGVVKRLLSAGADPNAVDEDGDTPLHYAAFRDHVDVARLLLGEKVDIDAPGEGKQTPLHYAARESNLAVLKVLIDSGANVHAVDSVGRIPLHQAAWNGRADIAKTLLSAGSDLHAKDEDGDTPLHYAAYRDHVDIAKLLLNEGAEVNAAGEDGFTPLHYAAQQSSLAVLKVLIESGVSIDAANDIGETPLHKAAEHGHLDVVKVLDEAGASKTIRDNKGNRPEDVVCGRADPDCTRATRLAIEDLLAP